MKRRTTLADCCLHLPTSWTLMVLTATICFVSCACGNKANNSQNSQTATKPVSGQQTSTSTYVAKEELESTYKQMVSAVKAQAGYELYGEFLNDGKYLNSFMRMDILKYLVVIPSDAALKTLDEVIFNNLIYPELVTQEHLSFFQKHTAFAAVAEGPNPSFRTFHNRMLNLDLNNKELNSGNFKTRVVHVEQIPPAIQLVFVENLIK
ncbi:MAG: hypothetical protein IPM34_11275 [Saprospiraceae bacterium]|nr:hypothetical protein [Saprospiraceae bacterium]